MALIPEDAKEAIGHAIRAKRERVGWGGVSLKAPTGQSEAIRSPQACAKTVLSRPMPAGEATLKSDARGQLRCVSCLIKLTHMEKIQVYLRKEELDALRKAARRSRRSVAALVREAVRKIVLMPAAEGPIAIWNGEPRRSSLDHDELTSQLSDSGW